MNYDPLLAAKHTDRSALKPQTLLRRTGILAYGVGSYLAGVAALMGLILLMLGALPFTGGPVHIHSPALAGLFNLGLITAFGLQHSLMARAGFKERWTRVIHPSMERPTYLLATGLVLLPVMWMWQPMPPVIWSVEGPMARGALTGLALLGWAYLFLASFAIDHFELFGLQQVWRAFRGKAPAQVPFRERWMYRFDRHPIMTGVLVGIWVTPVMTLGHLLFAAACSAYLCIGVHFEERALRRQWGAAYEDYRRRVGTLVPLPWSK